MKPPKPKPAPVPETKPKRPGILWVPTAQDIRTVRSMATWATHNEIAKVLGKSHVTLRKHFRAELDNGFLQAQDRVWRSLFNQAVGSPARAADKARGLPAVEAVPPNVKAAIAWLEFKGGASKRVTIVDGGTEVDPRMASESDLDAEIARLQKRPAVQKHMKTATVH